MKKVTISHEAYFPDDMSDDECFACALEIAGQAEINDDNITIEYNQRGPDEPERLRDKMKAFIDAL